MTLLVPSDIFDDDDTDEATTDAARAKATTTGKRGEKERDG